MGSSRGATSPLVLDADALNALASEPDLLQGSGEGSRLMIITPHPGEMARLADTSVHEVQANRLDVARDFAVQHQIYVVLKGYRTLIATPEGKVFINPLGNPGMATGGTGDVLTGVIAAWLAQLLDAEAACKLACTCTRSPAISRKPTKAKWPMTAGDLAAHLGDAVLDVTARRRVKPSNGQS